MFLSIPKITFAANDDIKDSECELRYRKDPVQENKEWKIKFNEELDSSSISSDNVLIQDEDGKKIYASVSLDEKDKDKKTVIVKPNSIFKQGKKYSITIKKDGFKAKKDGKKISKPVRMFFYIKNAYAGLPCEDGLIVVRNMVYSIDYLAKNSKLKNEILNDAYTIYYCYSVTEQKVKDIFGNVELDKGKVHPHYDKMTYVNENGEKSIYEWDNTEEEYKLIGVGVDADITVNSSAKVITVKVKNVQGIEDAVYFKLGHSNDVKRIGETIAFTSKDLVEPIFILNYNKNVIAKGSLNTQFSTSRKTSLKKVGDTNKGNTAGNINNNGYVVEDQEGYVFYNNTGDRNYLYKLDSNGMFNNAIGKDNAQYINVVGDWVYYSNYSDKGNLYKIKTDGTLRQKISEDMASYVTVSGDWIYFCNHSDGGRLYKIRPDGTSKSRISQSLNHESAYINVSGDWIYFTDVTDRHRPYVINTDGTYIAKLSEEWANSIQVYGDWIYYTSSTGVLSKVKKDGSGQIIPIKGQTREFDKGFHLNVVGSWLYYSNYLDGGKLYKIRTDGSGEKHKLVNDTTDYINIIGDYIYFTGKGKLFRVPIDTDGTIKPQQISKSNGQHNIIQMDDLKATVAFEDVNMKLVDMENKYLPEKVPGIMDDNTMHQFSVDWDRKHAIARNGIRTYIGDVIGYNRKVKFELTIPSEMLNESNTITVYNNPDKNADVLVVENLYDNNLVSTPPKLNVGDLVSVYDNKDCTKLLGKAVVGREGKYNKATIQRIELDKYGQRSAWITVTRLGKAESKPTEVRHGDVPGISKAEDVDNQEDFRFYEKGLGVGVDGRDLAITQWAPSQVMGKSNYSIYALSSGRLDISKDDCKPIATIIKNDKKWQGDKEIKTDSNKKDLKKGKYNMFIVGTFEGEASEDNRGKRPYVKGSVCSDAKIVDVTEEILPTNITLKTKGSVQGGSDIILSKAPAKDEQVWLIPTNTSRYIMEKVENWRSENNIDWPIDELQKVATRLEGDGSTAIIKAPAGMKPENKNYKDIEYNVLVVNKVGSSGLSKERITVDNKAPEMFNEFATKTILQGTDAEKKKYELKIEDKKPEDSFKVKVFDDVSNINTLSDPVSIYIIQRGVEDYNKELLDMAVKQKVGKIFTVNKGIPFKCNVLGLEAITKEEYNRHYKGAGPSRSDLTNYKVIAVDRAGNISNPVFFNIIVDIEKLSLIIQKADNYLFMLNDDQHKTLDPVLKQAKDLLSVATQKRQYDIELMCDKLESTMEKVGVPGLTANHEQIAKAVCNGVYLKDLNGGYIKQGSTIDSNLKLEDKTPVDDNIKITWNSDRKDVIDIMGKTANVKRQLKNTVVKLSAIISYNSGKKEDKDIKFEKTLYVTVKGLDIQPKIKSVSYDKSSNKVLVEFEKGKEESFINDYKAIISKTLLDNIGKTLGQSLGNNANSASLNTTGFEKNKKCYIYIVAVAKEDVGVVPSDYKSIVID
ncbi:DUF5050 domain-containing protein [Clostridium botulinum D/C]|nr:DUF5050 domain-containing protein [Clostridium botulinum D/C]QPW61928.1 DUF5050 domain-containing protein [Clostridium botulinum]MCD3239482.1 DUF5050 domain-containing protein [Clostridium botulinum D/C]MCD3267036.1 DUF5050 domain-containing protein [Clostridium botulinum D/C]MCD3298349.1 DUF5050 domain-containing protein [Clostridium botulinum D/C]